MTYALVPAANNRCNSPSSKLGNMLTGTIVNVEKRNLGELWAACSGGMGLFSMPRGKDFEVIRQLVRRKLHYDSLVTTNNVMSSD